VYLERGHVLQHLADLSNTDACQKKKSKNISGTQFSGSFCQKHHNTRAKKSNGSLTVAQHAMDVALSHSILDRISAEGCIHSRHNHALGEATLKRMTA
jgi:hypothetical protein